MTADAREFLATTDERFDAALLDLPDPHAPRMSELYVSALVDDLHAHLGDAAVVVAQAAAAELEPRSFRVVRDLLARPGLCVESFSAPVPSFGGSATFVVASRSGVSLGALGLTRYGA